MKIPKQAYTTEFKELAVKRVKDGQSISTVIKELGLGDQTLRNWVKASAEGKLRGAGGKVVTPEEMELSRLRVENLRLKRECEILKNRPSGIARPVWIETGCRHTLEPRKDCGRLLFGGNDPVKKPGPGEAADPTVVANYLTPFRKVIDPSPRPGA